MDNMEFEALLNDYLPETHKSGAVIEDAVITRKEMEYSFLDISSKLEGRVRSFEIEGLEIGDKISVQVIRSEDDFVIVSKLALDRLRELENYNVGDKIEGTVVKRIKGGFTVKIKNNNAFLPMSLAAANGQIVGNTYTFLVKEKTKKGLTLSRSELIRKEVNDFTDGLELGQTVKAKVKSLLDFGAILEIGPTTGLLHISELSWEQTKNVSDVLTVGQEVEVKIIELDKEKSKIKFSIKQLQENPWNSVKERHQIGKKSSGVIKEILDFGLVISIDGSNDDGFMHISDINYRKFFKLSNTFKVGDKIDFVILNIDDEKQRISLSAKALLDEIWENIDDVLKAGDIVKGKVLFVQNYGMFVELENKLEAFIRRSDFAWTREEAKEYAEGDIIDFMIVHVDVENKKLSGSIKETVTSPWEEAMESFEVGQIIKTSVSDKIESGVLVHLTERFKGLVPGRDLDKEYEIGEEITALIIDANRNRNSIILSVTKIQENLDRAETDELMKKYGAEDLDV